MFKRLWFGKPPEGSKYGFGSGRMFVYFLKHRLKTSYPVYIMYLMYIAIVAARQVQLHRDYPLYEFTIWTALTLISTSVVLLLTGAMSYIYYQQDTAWMKKEWQKLNAKQGGQAT